ncbi:MAG: type II toxin-antitoxin system Phd/YefM family antitoxin [Thermomicrobiales bacterium]
MQRAVSATEAKNRFGTVLDWVIKDGNDVVVERQGRPLAAIVSIAEYEAFQELREQERRRCALETLRGVQQRVSARNSDLTPGQIEEIADQFSRDVMQGLVEKGKVRFEE